MCEKCGCSDTADHSHEREHQQAPGVAAVLSHNDRLAERNRGYALAKRVVVVNLLSFSRSNVHALVERTVAEYGRRRRVAVITAADVEALGAHHDHHHPHDHSHETLPDETAAVDAHAVGHVLSHLDLDPVDLVLIENGGSAACQSVFDLGETARVAVFSVREGELKPLKFPLLFANARAVVINEVNQAGGLGFDAAKARSNLRQAAPKAAVLEVAPETGAGMDGWYAFLDELVKLNGKYKETGVMAKQSIAQAVKSGRVLVSDGAWGTFLQKKGMKPGECPELWCVEHRADVLDIAKGYIAAGADMIESDSFGGTRCKLEHFGLAVRTVELNKAAAAISREAAGSDKWVIASVGPTGLMTAMGDVTEQDLYNFFKEQVVALAAGGADAICVETMSALDEAAAAIRATRDNTKCEVICTFTFERTVQGEYRTMMGVSPAEAAKASVAAGAHVIGANCGNGMERMVEIVKEMRKAAPTAPILVHANAGLPKNVNGVDVFPETPADMAGRVPALVAAGANIIGGCCGTTPAHIAAIKQAVAGLKK